MTRETDGLEALLQQAEQAANTMQQTAEELLGGGSVWAGSSHYLETADLIVKLLAALRVARTSAEWQDLVSNALLDALPMNERHGYCFCPGPDIPTFARHYDTCPERIRQRFAENLAKLSGDPLPSPEAQEPQ